MTLFEKIIAGEIPCKKAYEDNEVFAFHDINPQAPTHILCVPKKPIARIAQATEQDEALLGKLLLAAQKIAKQEGLDNGFRLVINNGSDGGETVPHLHVHILGGKALAWVF